PLFGLTILLTRVRLTKRAYGGLYRYQRDSSRIIPTRSSSTAIESLSRTSARPGRTRRRAPAEPRRACATSRQPRAHPDRARLGSRNQQPVAPSRIDSPVER